ncbi:MAG: carbonic anhydrase [Bacteroidales bacterium]
MKTPKLSTLTMLLIVMGLFVTCKSKNADNASSAENASVTVQINTPDDAIQELKNGNKRFLENILVNTNYKQRIEETKSGQKPHSVVIACMDSRVPPEIIFDQGIGNIFSIRVAGNVEDENVLGSLEYAVEHTGSKLIVVMGHSHCGAVTGAVKDVELGNLTQLLAQIKPAIVKDASEQNIIDETAKNNVKITIQDILSKSEVVSEMVHEGKVKIIGAFYDVETGIVTFME